MGDAAILYRVMRREVVDTMVTRGATAFPPITADESPCEAFEVFGRAVQQCAHENDATSTRDRVVMRFAVPMAFLARADVTALGERRERRWCIQASAWQACNEVLVAGMLMRTDPFFSMGAPWTPDEVRRARGLEDPGTIASVVMVALAPDAVARALSAGAKDVVSWPFGRKFVPAVRETLVLRMHGQSWSWLLGDSGAFDAGPLSRLLSTRVIECSVCDSDGHAYFHLLQDGVVVEHHVWEAPGQPEPWTELDRALRREEAWWPTWLGLWSFADKWQLLDRDDDEAQLLLDPPQVGGGTVPVEQAVLVRW